LILRQGTRLTDRTPPSVKVLGPIALAELRQAGQGGPVLRLSNGGRDDSGVGQDASWADIQAPRQLVA
jgi:hypothetical protein